MGNAHEVTDAEVEAAARLLAQWGIRSRHSEWTDQETQRSVAKDALRAAAAVRAEQVSDEQALIEVAQDEHASKVRIAEARDAALARAEAAEAEVERLRTRLLKSTRQFDDAAAMLEAERRQRDWLPEAVRKQRDRALAQVAAVAALADEGGCIHLNDLWGRIRAALDDPDTALRGVRAEVLREAAEQFRQAERDGYLFLNGSAERMPWEVVAQSLDERADRIARAGGEG